MNVFTKATVYIVLCFFSINVVKAQNVTITLKATNKNGKTIPNVSFEILKVSDSTTSLVNANNKGIATVSLLKANAYTITATGNGFSATNKGVLVNTEASFSFVMVPKNDGDIIIKSTRKPIMQQVDDKTIINTESLAASSSNGYEVLEKAPGLFIDPDGNIYLSSTTPATIYINGREMKMSSTDVATMLKSLPPNAIERLEVLRTPSAKMDAASSGGVVNVILRKGVKIGLTGSVSGGFNQGKFGNQNIGFNINNNNNKVTTYVTLQLAKRNTFDELNTDRNFNIDSIIKQRAYTTTPAKTVYLGFGVSKEVSKKLDISYDSRISFNASDVNTDNASTIEKISTSNIFSRNNANINNSNNVFSHNNGINAKYKFDTLGSEITGDISFSQNINRTDQLYNTGFTIPVGFSLLGNGNIKTSRSFFIAQTDYTKKLKHRLTLETGLKSTYLTFNNNTKFLRGAGSTAVLDSKRTNTFNYIENINALYGQASKTFGKDAVLKFGVRLENTNMDGKQTVPALSTFSIKRTDAFPYVYLSKNIVKLFGMSLRGYAIYRKTISRPNYDFLNPFPRFVDQYLTEQGNPNLRPQFTTNYEVNISFDDFPILALGVNETKDIFSNVIYQATDGRSTAIRTYDNLGKNRETYARFVVGIPPGGRYFFVFGGQYNYNNYDGVYEGSPLTFKRGSWRYFTFHSLKLDKRSQLNINGFMIQKGQQNFYELGSFGQLTTSVNRQFLNRKLIVTLTVNDIFYTNNNVFALNQGTVKANGYRQSDSRRFGLNLRYNFGMRKKEQQGNVLANDGNDK